MQDMPGCGFVGDFESMLTTSKMGYSCVGIIGIKYYLSGSSKMNLILSSSGMRI